MKIRYFLLIPCLAMALFARAQRPQLSEDLPLLDKAWGNDSEKFSFAILGDKTSGGEGKWPIYDRAVDAINLLKPDFVITVGDMIQGHMETRPEWDAEWAEYREHAARIEAPLFFTVGNHDIANLACYGFWKEDFGRTYYSFDYKGCHFLIFNTEEERIDGRGPAWRKMMDWAKADLAASAGARQTYVFFHKPMWDDPRFMGDWAELEAALGPRPFTVIAGHEHYHSTEFRNGNPYQPVAEAPFLQRSIRPRAVRYCNEQRRMLLSTDGVGCSGGVMLALWGYIPLLCRLCMRFFRFSRGFVLPSASRSPTVYGRPD